MKTRATAVLLALLACAAPAGAQPKPGLASSPGAELEAGMKRFMVAVRSERPDSIAAFLPRAGGLTWVHTLHETGRKRVGLWRFPAVELPRALRDRRALAPSFTLLVEGQPIGLFRHETMTRAAFARQKGWRRVGTRFVPAGEPPTAALFVEWRREGGRWVVARYGDERFHTAKLPDWCC